MSDDIQKKHEKVVSGKAKKKKRRLLDIFIAEDIDNVKEYVYQDVFIPSIKKLIRDAICNSTDMLLYRDSRGSSKGGSSISRPAYRKAFEKERDHSHYSEMRTNRQYADVIVDDRADAEEILRTMDDICEVYDFVSVADLYDISGLDTKPTDNNYGWTKTGVRDARIVRTMDGYLLKFPKPMPLD